MRTEVYSENFPDDENLVSLAVLIKHLDRLTPQLGLDHERPNHMWPTGYKADRKSVQLSVRNWYQKLKDDTAYASLKELFDRVEVRVLIKLDTNSEGQQNDLWDALDKEQARVNGQVYWNTAREKAVYERQFQTRMAKWATKWAAMEEKWGSLESDDEDKVKVSIEDTDNGALLRGVAAAKGKGRESPAKGKAQPSNPPRDRAARAAERSRRQRLRSSTSKADAESEDDN